MRLTLRTLLAYLDDILEPAQTKEIGTKITESKFATGLVDRIRDVMRRRRLTAPELLGESVNDDPNMVAEYLDNTLPPEKVADIEKVCLESDVQLAEVAACHQILTLVLGEPVEINPESRRRMYTLVGEVQAAQAAAASKRDGSSADHAAEPERAEEAAAAQRREAGNGAGTHVERVPEYLRPRPFWQRPLPVTLVCTIIGVAVGVVITDRDFRSLWKTTPAAAPPENLVAQGGGPLPQEPALPKPAEDETADAKEQPGDVAPEKVRPAGTPVAVADDAAGDQRTAPSADKGTKAEPDAPTGTPVADTDKPAPAAAPTAPAAEPSGDRNPVVAVLPRRTATEETTPPPAPAPAQLSPPVKYASSTGILLRFDPQHSDWFVVPLTAGKAGEAPVIAPDAWIASPEPFDSVLDVGPGKCRVTLRGDTSVRVLGLTPAAPFGFDVRRGRMIFESSPDAAAEGAASAPLTLALAVRGEMWRIELTNPRTTFALEINPAQPEKLDEDLTPRSFEGAIYLLSGSLRLTTASGRVRSLTEPSRFVLTPGQTAPAAEGAPGDAGKAPQAGLAEAEPLSAAPRWAGPDPPQMSLASRTAAAQYLKEFIEDQPLLLSIGPVVKDDRPRISELAVKTLALTEQYPALVRSLAEGQHEESLDAAIVGLRTWLSMDPENGKLLRDELPRVFHPADADAVYRLLWGFGKADVRNRDASMQLVNWLEHDHLAVRQLAFYHVFRLTGQKFNYRADLALPQRTAAVSRLRTTVSNRGGLVRSGSSRRDD